MYQAPHYTTNILSSASLFLFILDLALPSMPPLLRGRRLLPPQGGGGYFRFLLFLISLNLDTQQEVLAMALWPLGTMFPRMREFLANFNQHKLS